MATIQTHNEIDLASLSEVYGDPDDPQFATRLAAKKEFVKAGDMRPVPGKLFPHQKNLVQLLSSKSALHEMAVIWPTGRGKSTLIAQLMRMIATHPARFGNKVNKQRFLIIVKKSIIEQWKAELEKYPEFTTKKLRDGQSVYKIKGRQKALTSAISKVVILKRQDEFAKELTDLKKYPDDASIIRTWSVDMIVIDEVHTTRTHADPVYDSNGIISNLIDPNGDKSQVDKETKIAYVQMRRLFQLVTGGLKIIMTATPMFDKPTELVSVLSFVLPPEKQLDIEELQEAIAVGPQAIRDYLEPKLRGRVSFLPEGTGLAPVFDEGQVFPRIVDGEEIESSIKVVNVRMLPEQEQVYANVRERNLRETDISKAFQEASKVKGDKREKFFSESRKALNFVYLIPGNPEKNTQTNFEYFCDEEITPGGVMISDEEFMKRLLGGDTKPTAEAVKKAIRERAKLKSLLAGNVIFDPPRQLTRAAKRKMEAEGITKRQDLAPFTFKFRYERELFRNCPPRNDHLKLFGEGSKLDEKRLQVIRRMSAKAARIIEIVHYDMKRVGEGELAYCYHPWLKNGGGILLGMCFDLMGYERFDGVEEDDATRVDNRPRYAFMMGEPGSTDSRNRNIKKIVNHPSNAFGDKIRIIIASDVTSTGLSFTNVRKFIHLGPAFNLTRQPEGRTNRADSHRAFPRPEQRFVRRFFMATTLGTGEQTIDHQIWFQIEVKEGNIIPVERALGDISTDAAFNQPGRGVPQTDLTTYHLHWADEEFDAIEKKIRHFFLLRSSYSFHDFRVLLANEHRDDTVTWVLTNMLGRRDLVRDRFGFCLALREHNGIYYLSNALESVKVSKENSSHPLVLHDRFLQEYSSAIRVPLPEDFTTISSAVTAQASKSSMPEHDMGAFQGYWETVDGESRMAMLERALTGQVENKAIATFILKDLAVVWFNDGKSIFHYLDEMRPKGNGGNYQANRHKIDGKSGTVSIRILHQGDVKFKQANEGETNRAVKMITERWNKRDSLIRSQSGLNFTVIYNVSSDREVRVRNDLNVKYKTDGTRDGRSDKGKKVGLYEAYKLAQFLWEMQYENPNDIERAPGSANDVAKRVMSLAPKLVTKGWSHERFSFYWRWLEDPSATPGNLGKLIYTRAEKNDWVFKK